MGRWAGLGGCSGRGARRRTAAALAPGRHACPIRPIPSLPAPTHCSLRNVFRREFITDFSRVEGVPVRLRQDAGRERSGDTAQGAGSGAHSRPWDGVPARLRGACSSLPTVSPPAAPAPLPALHPPLNAAGPVHCQPGGCCGHGPPRARVSQLLAGVLALVLNRLTGGGLMGVARVQGQLAGWSRGRGGRDEALPALRCTPLHPPPILRAPRPHNPAQTRLSTNGGADWAPIPAPANKWPKCGCKAGLPADQCHLHLHGPTSWLAPQGACALRGRAARAGRGSAAQLCPLSPHAQHHRPPHPDPCAGPRPNFYSHEGAPGLAIATGNVGPHLDFMSGPCGVMTMMGCAAVGRPWAGAATCGAGAAGQQASRPQAAGRRPAHHLLRCAALLFWHATQARPAPMRRATAGRAGRRWPTLWVRCWLGGGRAGRRSWPMAFARSA